MCVVPRLNAEGVCRGRRVNELVTCNLLNVGSLQARTILSRVKGSPQAYSVYLATNYDGRMCVRNCCLDKPGQLFEAAGIDLCIRDDGQSKAHIC